MAIAATQLSGCGTVRGQFVCDDGLGMYALVLEQLAQQSQGGIGVAALLDQHVQYLAFVIYCTPQPHPLAGDLHNHFVQVPTTRRFGSRSSKVLCERLAELQCPAADCLVAGFDATLRQQFLNVSKNST